MTLGQRESPRTKKYHEDYKSPLDKRVSADFQNPES